MAGAARKIVIIDDEMEVGEVIKDFLDEEGYETHISTDAQKGLDLVQKIQPELVLLDILMPKIGGLECLKRIKAFRPQTIVIVISGIEDEEVAKQAIRRGAFDYIHKPFDLVYLKENLLARIFDEKPND